MTAIDLSRLPAPAVIEALDYETIFAAMLADLRSRFAEYDALVESDPAYKILQVCAYRELLLRQRINDAAHSVMVSHAQGSDLEQLGALFGISRQLLDPGDAAAVPPVPPRYEALERFRQRIPLSLEGFSTAGPTGAYIFHSLNASAEVKDVAVASPAPGEVLVTILSQSGDGRPSAELLSTVSQKLNHDEIRPLTDKVTVQGAAVKRYQVDAVLLLDSGPDTQPVKQLAITKVTDYVTRQHQLGAAVTLSGLYAALHQNGVQNVQLNSPSGDIAVAAAEAAWCSQISVTIAAAEVAND